MWWADITFPPWPFSRPSLASPAFPSWEMRSARHIQGLPDKQILPAPSYPESHQSSLQEADQSIIGVVPAVQNPEAAAQWSQGQEKELDGGPSEPGFLSPGAGLYVELEGGWQCLETLGEGNQRDSTPGLHFCAHSCFLSEPASFVWKYISASKEGRGCVHHCKRTVCS